MTDKQPPYMSPFKHFYMLCSSARIKSTTSVDEDLKHHVFVVLRADTSDVIEVLGTSSIADAEQAVPFLEAVREAFDLLIRGDR